MYIEIYDVALLYQVFCAVTSHIILCFAILYDAICEVAHYSTCVV